MSGARGANFHPSVEGASWLDITVPVAAASTLNYPLDGQGTGTATGSLTLALAGSKLVGYCQASATAIANLTSIEIVDTAGATIDTLPNPAVAIEGCWPAQAVGGMQINQAWGIKVTGAAGGAGVLRFFFH